MPRCCCVARVTQRAGYSKVPELADVLRIEKYVAWLEVTVRDGIGPGAVEELESRADAGGYTDSFFPWERSLSEATFKGAVW